LWTDLAGKLLEILGETLAKLARLDGISLRISPGALGVKQIFGHARHRIRNLEIEVRIGVVRNIVQGARKGGGDHRPGVRQVDALAHTVWQVDALAPPVSAAGPAGIHQPHLCRVLRQLLTQ